MRIAVLMKQVPATDEPRRMDPSSGRIDRAAATAEPDEIGERALELALRAKDADRSTEVVAVTMGPAGARDVLKKALTMGADRGVHVCDDRLCGADAMVTAEVLAGVLRAEFPDLVVGGVESTDGRGGILASAIAERLGLPAIVAAEQVELADGAVTALVTAPGGRARVRASLPAVLAVTERAPDPRFPSFKGIIAAKRRPIDQVAVAPSGATATSVVLESRATPARIAGIRITDDGSAAARLAAFLRDSGFVEKGA